MGLGLYYYSIYICSTLSFDAVLKMELSGSQAVFLHSPWSTQRSDAVTHQPMQMAVHSNKCKYFVLTVTLVPFKKRIQCLEIALELEKQKALIAHGCRQIFLAMDK